MIITFTNVIGAIRTAFSVVRSGLKMWLGFETSETLGREEVVNGDFSNDTTSWSEEGSSTISVGTHQGKTDVANINILNTSNGSRIEQAFDYVNGQTYQVSVEVYLVSGSFRVDSANGFVSGNFVSTTSPGSWQTLTKTITAIQTGTDVIWLRSKDEVSQFYVNSISIKELTQITPDKSGNNNVGELFTGKALEFDGTNDYVNTTGFEMSGTSATFAFWIYPKDTAYQFVMDLDGTIRTILGLFNGGSGQVFAFFNSGFKQFGTPIQNQWQRVVFRVNATTVECYVDGVKSGSTLALTSPIDLSTVGNSVIGGRFDTTNAANRFDGSLSDFQIYNAYWSTDDITYDYANPNKLAIDNPSTSLNVTNLKAYWALSEGDGLVAYDSGTNLEEEEVQNGTFNLGSEEVVNGDFSDGETGWLIQDGWSVTDNKLNVNTDDGNEFARQNSILEVGKTYVLTLDVSLDVGEIKFESGGTPNFIITTSDTTISHTFVATLTDVIFRRNVIPTRGYIDNISVKEVPNWTLGDGWSVGDSNKITRTAQSQSTSATQNISFVSGKSYSITYTLDVSAGSFLIRLGGVGILDTPARSVSDTYTEVITATANHTILNLRAFDGTFAGSISNVSVREVTASDHGGLINGADYVDAQPRIPQLGMMNWSKGSNLYSFSEDFENSDWNKNTGTTITNNYATSPNGDLTAARYVGTGFSGLYDTFTLTTNSYTLSFYVKSNTGQNQNCRLILDSVVSSNILVTTDWARISYTQNGSGSPGTTNGIFRDAGNSDIDILIWGAQLEQSSSAGAYRLTDGGATLNSTVIPNPTIPTQDILGNAVRDRLNSFNLDGSGYAEVADDTDLDFGTGAFTMESWVKADFLFQGSSINVALNLGGDTAGAGTAGIISFSSNKLGGYVNAAVLEADSTFTQGNWYHVAITRNISGLCTLYIDSVAQTDTENAGGSVTNSNTKQIGRDTNLTRFYQNLISDVRLYGAELSATEVENNYNAGLSAHTNN